MNELAIELIHAEPCACVALVYASATADSFTIEITVRTDQLLDTAKVLTELELI